MVQISHLELSIVIAAGSLLVSIIALSITYLQYKSPNQVRVSREQIMRDRFAEEPSERDLWPNRKLEFAAPRVRRSEFFEWVKSLRPGAGYPLRTQFSIRFIYPEYPNAIELVGRGKSEPEDYIEPPPPKVLESNEKLQKLGVFPLSRQVNQCTPTMAKQLRAR